MEIVSLTISITRTLPGERISHSYRGAYYQCQRSIGAPSMICHYVERGFDEAVLISDCSIVGLQC